MPQKVVIVQCEHGCRPKPPNRSKPREVNPATVARLWCKVREKGYSVGQLKNAIAERCPDEDDCDCERIRSQLRILQTILTAAAVAVGLAIGGLTGGVLARILLRFASAQRVLEYMERAKAEIADASDVLDAILKDGDWEVIIRDTNNP